MKYEDKQGGMYLIYPYSYARNTWKIEDYPFTGKAMEVDESYAKRFIRENKLKEVAE